MTRGIDHWWRSPDHHRLMTRYLARRRLQPAVQALSAAGTAAYGTAATAMLFSPHGPQGGPAVAVCITVVALSALITAYWMRRWPTVSASIAIVVLSLTGLVLVCLAQSSPEAGLLGSTGFAVLAGYVAFVHSARLLALVIAGGVATIAVCVARLALAGDIAMALSIIPVAVVALVILPFAGQLLARLLGADAHRSDTDALTGLLNRHGFHSAADELAERLAQTAGGRLTIAMVDLDHFKRINDTLGHTTGDRVLRDVGAALRAAADDDALVVRFGGEEFLIAEVQSSARCDLGGRVLAALDGAELGVTASVGMDSATRLPRDPRAIRAALDRLLARADAAMYTAKRSGGNAACRAGIPDAAAARSVRTSAGRRRQQSYNDGPDLLCRQPMSVDVDSHEIGDEILAGAPASVGHQHVDVGAERIPPSAVRNVEPLGDPQPVARRYAECYKKTMKSFTQDDDRWVVDGGHRHPSGEHAWQRVDVDVHVASRHTTTVALEPGQQEPSVRDRRYRRAMNNILRERI